MGGGVCLFSVPDENLCGAVFSRSAGSRLSPVVLAIHRLLAQTVIICKLWEEYSEERDWTELIHLIDPRRLKIVRLPAGLTKDSPITAILNYP
jgi:hypothetical protein